MKGLEDQQFLVAYVLSNLIAIGLLFTAWKRPAIARILFVILFAWACLTNWSISSKSPERYLEYAALAFSEWYRQFITGWFREHVQLVVGFIATSQGLIA